MKGAKNRGVMVSKRKRLAYPTMAERVKVSLKHGTRINQGNRLARFLIRSVWLQGFHRLTCTTLQRKDFDLSAWALSYCNSCDLVTIDPALLTSPPTNARLMSLVIPLQLGRV